MQNTWDLLAELCRVLATKLQALADKMSPPPPPPPQVHPNGAGGTGPVKPK